MEFSEKLVQLRKQKNMTQEELAEALFVSRTAISKWESGRGYPSIDSLKAIADYYSITVDELLSGNELLSIAKKDNEQKVQHMRDLVYGLVDCANIIFLLAPMFGQKNGDSIEEISLFFYRESEWYILTAYYLIVFLTIAFGVFTLAMQNCQGKFWIHNKGWMSLFLSAAGSVLFMLSMQPYAAFFTFLFFIIKGVLLIKRQ